VQPVPKTAYRSSHLNEHNCLRWDSNLGLLTPQSDTLTTSPVRPEGQLPAGAAGDERNTAASTHIFLTNEHKTECDKDCWIAESSLLQQIFAISAANLFWHYSYSIASHFTFGPRAPPSPRKYFVGGSALLLLPVSRVIWLRHCRCTWPARAGSENRNRSSQTAISTVAVPGTSDRAAYTSRLTGVGVITSRELANFALITTEISTPNERDVVDRYSLSNGRAARPECG